MILFGKRRLNAHHHSACIHFRFCLLRNRKKFIVLTAHLQRLNLPISFLACANQRCSGFNKFNADNLSIVECMAKTKLSADYTVKPATSAKATAKARLWSVRNYLKRLSYVSSSSSDMAVLSRQLWSRSGTTL